MAVKPTDVAAVFVDPMTLKAWENNPRDNDDAVEQVARSIERFGFGAPIVARKANNEVIAGHTRLRAALLLGLERVPVRFLDVSERDAHLLAIADNKLTEVAAWNEPLLRTIVTEFSNDELGVSVDDLPGFTADEMDRLLRGESVYGEPSGGDSRAETDEDGDGDGDTGSDDPNLNPYTRKIKPPVYEPTGPCPPVATLFDTTRSDALVAQIDACEDLPPEVAAFLRHAARRHTSFHYQRIAEFYAHAPAHVQDLMERSALVIIDFNKAIEYGFVKLTDRLGELADLEEAAAGSEAAKANQPSTLPDGTTDERICIMPRSRVKLTLLEHAARAGVDRVLCEQSIEGWSADGVLYRRWYDSLATGQPDFGIYSSDDYIGEAWACWTEYSAKYLREIAKPDRCPPDGVAAAIGRVDRVVDVGCGLGLTTAALAQQFVGAKVYGTNVPGSAQYRIACELARTYGFSVTETEPPTNDDERTLLWATEYFEHFREPLVELRRILSAVRPSVLMIANTFTQPAPGHFPSYLVDGEEVAGERMQSLFNEVLSSVGYVKMRTGMWNQKPTVWTRDA